LKYDTRVYSNVKKIRVTDRRLERHLFGYIRKLFPLCDAIQYGRICTWKRTVKLSV